MSKNADGKVRVRIWASQRVKYDQVVEMTAAEYRELMKRYENDKNFGRCHMDDDIGGWLDLHDCDAGGDLEDIEIKLVKDEP